MEVYSLGRKLYDLFGNVKPKKVNGQIAARTEFYRNKLRQIIKGLWDAECPNEWSRDYLLDLLLFEGYVLITDTDVGIVPIRSGLTGYNYMNFPIETHSELPILGTIKRTLGKDAELIYLEWDETRTFFNFNETIRIFAEKLASCDAGIDVNIMNSKLAYIAEAESKAQAEAIKDLMDDVSVGEPLVVYRKDSISTTPMQLLTNNLRQNFIAGDIQDTKRTIYNELFTYLGINNANTDKKERLITSEVDSNYEELVVNVYNMEENVKRCVERVKKMFPSLNFNIKLKFDSSSREEKMYNDSNGDTGTLGSSEPKR